MNNTINNNNNNNLSMDSLDDLASFGSESGILMSMDDKSHDHEHYDDDIDDDGTDIPTTPRPMKNVKGEAATDAPTTPTNQTGGQEHHHHNDNNNISGLPSSYYNPMIGWIVGQMSPGSRSFSSDRSVYGRNQSHAVNAVHMHIQENAKIPNYNKAIDRSNTNRTTTTTTTSLLMSGPGNYNYNIMNNNNNNVTGGPSSSSTTAATTDVQSHILAGGSGDFSLAELFLSKESNYRKSRAQNYENTGSLVLPDSVFDGQRRLSGDNSHGTTIQQIRTTGDYHHQHHPSSSSSSLSPRRMNNIGISNNNNSHNNSNSNNLRNNVDDVESQLLELDALAAVIDPTPWSEIEMKMHIQKEKRLMRTAVNNHPPPHQRIGDHPHHSSYYPYGRHHQLPIPGMPHSPPSRPVVVTVATVPPPHMALGTGGDGGSGGGGNNKDDIHDDVVSTSPPVISAQAIATAAAIVATAANPEAAVVVGTTINPSQRMDDLTTTTTTTTTRTTNTTTQAPITAIKAPLTAAAMSQNQQSLIGIKKGGQPSSLGSTQQTVTATSSASSKTSTTTTTTVPALNPVKPPERHFQRQRINTPAPPHAAAHTTSRASVLAAANQKSQYGFGGNHTVPSVPAPPPTSQLSRPKIIIQQPLLPPTNTTTTATVVGRVPVPVPTITTVISQNQGNNTASQSTIGTALTKPVDSSSKPLSPSIGGGGVLEFDDAGQNNHSEVAYERKKQRAKDARVKLNESIDRLSVAMSLAGSESKQRINQLQSSGIVVTDGRAKSIRVNQDCAHLAEQAKKWDRPNFVGTAASIIQALNAECEALMAELLAMQRLLDAATPTVGTATHNQLKEKGETTNGTDSVPPFVESSVVPVKEVEMNTVSTSSSGDSASVAGLAGVKDASVAGKAASGPTATAGSVAIGSPVENFPSASHPENKRHENEVYPTSSESPNKRARVENIIVQVETDNVPQIDPPPEEDDDDTVIYGGIATMLDPITLCRCPQVSHQWRTMKGFEDDKVWFRLSVQRFGFYNVRQWTERLGDGETGTKKVSNKVVYREMNAANVMPHFTQDGVSLLGDAKIPGRVSGWVFIVERSNGETLRSVKREPGSIVAGGGAYQSRPVVELRIVVQNTGMAGCPVILKNQLIAVDVSTRRSGGELREITWDDRFVKVVKNLDGTVRTDETKNRSATSTGETNGEICRLHLFEMVVIEVHINARGCSTTSKFQQRSNFTKLLVSLDGTTVPMVIPFLRDHFH